MNGERPPEQPRESPQAGAVVGGLVLGLLLAFVYMVVAVLATWSSLEVSTTIAVATFAAPAVVGVLLLVIPRTRRAGSGFVLGLAVGLIVLSAVCVAPAGLG